MHGPFAADTTKSVSKEWSNLPKHSSVRITARIWAVQSWDNEKAVVEVENAAAEEEALKVAAIQVNVTEQAEDAERAAG